MDNHEHHHNHSEPKKENIIATSIVIAAVLISASILYSNSRLLKEFGAEAVGKRAESAGQTGSTVTPTAPDPAAPAGPVSVQERADAPVLGDKDAKVTFIEFTDFQCPFCQRFYSDAFQQIKEKYVNTGKVKVVFRHFPLPFHAKAQKAGEAAECAHRQGKFIEYHDVLFQKMQADGTGLDVDSLKQYAADLRLNTARFNSCLDNSDTAQVVKNDIAAGTAAGVSGTPTMFINGTKIVGAQSFTNFQQALDAALK